MNPNTPPALGSARIAVDSQQETGEAIRAKPRAGGGRVHCGRSRQGSLHLVARVDARRKRQARGGGAGEGGKRTKHQNTPTHPEGENTKHGKADTRTEQKRLGRKTKEPGNTEKRKKKARNRRGKPRHEADAEGDRLELESSLKKKKKGSQQSSGRRSQSTAKTSSRTASAPTPRDEARKKEQKELEERRRKKRRTPKANIFQT